MPALLYPNNVHVDINEVLSSNYLTYVDFVNCECAVLEEVGANHSSCALSNWYRKSILFMRKWKVAS